MTSTHSDSDTHAIAQVAYGLWEKAGRPSGRDLEFWLRAEREVQARTKPPVPFQAARTTTGATWAFPTQKRPPHKNLEVASASVTPAAPKRTNSGMRYGSPTH